MKALKVFFQCQPVLAALLLVAGTTQLHAQAYLHAIRDLREARAIISTGLNNPVHVQAAQAANVEIDQAINGLKAASADGGQNLGSVPPPKPMPPMGKFQQALGLLNEASKDISAPNPNPAITDHQQHALQHIQNAENIIRQAMQTP